MRVQSLNGIQLRSIHSGITSDSTCIAVFRPFHPCLDVYKKSKICIGGNFIIKTSDTNVTMSEFHGDILHRYREIKTRAISQKLKHCGNICTSEN